MNDTVPTGPTVAHLSFEPGVDRNHLHVARPAARLGTNEILASSALGSRLGPAPRRPRLRPHHAVAATDTGCQATVEAQQ